MLRSGLDWNRHSLFEPLISETVGRFLPLLHFKLHLMNTAYINTKLNTYDLFYIAFIPVTWFSFFLTSHVAP
ncbi:hypothetical protein MTBLM1_30071 [Rhodospirillaceae bacterium LM-1]|nr:hypothetical protein MTBLM1_30071 [Rhodospirillaceae bacterium LM-1]